MTFSNGGTPRPGDRARRARERHREAAREASEVITNEESQEVPLRSQDVEMVLGKVDTVSDDPEMQKAFEESVESTLTEYLSEEEDPDISLEAETDVLLVLNEGLSSTRRAYAKALEQGNITEAAAIGIERDRLQEMLGVVAEKSQLLSPRIFLNALSSGMERSSNRLEKLRGRSAIADELVGFCVSQVRVLGDGLSKKYEADPGGTLRRLDAVSAALTAKSGELFRDVVDTELAGAELNQVTKVLNLVQTEITKLEMLRQDMKRDVEQKDQVSSLDAARDAADHHYATRSTESLESTVSNPEVKEKDRELLDELFREGGVLVHMSLPSEYSANGTNGFQTVVDRRLDPWATAELPGSPSGAKSEREAMLAHGVHEFMTIKPRVKPARFETRRKGLFGKERVQVGEPEAWRHSELVPGGSDEPLVDLVYATADNRHGAYQDHSGRSGQSMKVGIALPESLARKALAAMRENPLLARQMVERVSRERFNISEDDWETGSDNNSGYPLKPPYESWNEAAGGISKMYFEEPGAGSGYNEESVVEF